MLTLSQLLGFPHYDYLLPYLSAKQLHEWRLWLRHYVPTANRNDPFWATLLSMYHNCHTDKADHLPPERFMLHNQPEEDPEQVLLDIRRCVRVLKG